MRSAKTIVRIKRVYEPPAREDGCRVLVDRLWPRGLKRSDADLSAWLSDIAPTDKLRRWFAHDAARWEEFCRRYFAELDSNPAVGKLVELVRQGTITLLYAARDTEHNNTVALQRYLTRK